jgi:uncharacterized protein YggE
MEHNEGPIVSVRGEATRSMPPDSCLLTGAISVSQPSKIRAVGDTSMALRALTTDLALLGGVALTVETERARLTWSARAATTWVERNFNQHTGRQEPTGNIISSVDLTIEVRDFDLLERVGGVLAHHESFHVHGVHWNVDDDNPGWSVVRAAAIDAAVRKGHDYATALGGSLLRIQELADVGLLDGSDVARGAPVAHAAFSSAPSEDLDTPSLDPVPQELWAAVEARFVATGVTLGAPSGSLPR